MPALRRLATSVWLLCLLPFSAAASPAVDPLDQAIGLQRQNHEAEQRSQHRIEQLDDATQEMVDEYRELLAEIENLQVYNDQVARLVGSQEQDLAALDAQFREIEVTRRNILPLMLRMLEVLERFVSLDAPFLQRERALRLQELRALIDRADISLAEKYRRLMEAYLIEANYGHSVEAYTGDLEAGGGRQTVDLLRFGRVGLYYLTLDGGSGGYWDNDLRQWQPLSRDMLSAVSQGLRIARKQAAPDLVTLPVAAPEAVQ